VRPRPGPATRARAGATRAAAAAGSPEGAADRAAPVFRVAGRRVAGAVRVFRRTVMVFRSLLVPFWRRLACPARAWRRLTVCFRPLDRPGILSLISENSSTRGFNRLHSGALPPQAPLDDHARSDVPEPATCLSVAAATAQNAARNTLTQHDTDSLVAPNLPLTSPGCNTSAVTQFVERGQTPR